MIWYGLKSFAEIVKFLSINTYNSNAHIKKIVTTWTTI